MILPTAVLILALQPTGVPSDAFERGKTAFDRGEYAQAIQLLRPLLYPVPRLRSEGEIVEAHRMIAFGLVYQKDNAGAAQEFRKVLQLRPDYRPDSLLDPPQVIDIFNGVLRQYQGELATLEAQRRAAEIEERQRLERARNGPQVVERTVIQNSYLVNFIPFGAGQFQNGHRAKGWAFLVSEGVLGATSLGAFAVNFATYGVRPKIKCAPSMTGQTSEGCSEGQIAGPEQDNSKTLTRIQVLTGALFFATAAWGVVDALIHYRDQVPAGEKPLEPRAPTSRRGDKLQVGLAPFVAPGVMGGALGFRF